LARASITRAVDRPSPTRYRDDRYPAPAAVAAVEGKVEFAGIGLPRRRRRRTTRRAGASAA